MSESTVSQLSGTMPNERSKQPFQTYTLPDQTNDTTSDLLAPCSSNRQARIPQSIVIRLRRRQQLLQRGSKVQTKSVYRYKRTAPVSPDTFLRHMVSTYRRSRELSGVDRVYVPRGYNRTTTRRKENESLQIKRSENIPRTRFERRRYVPPFGPVHALCDLLLRRRPTYIGDLESV